MVKAEEEEKEPFEGASFFSLSAADMTADIFSWLVSAFFCLYFYGNSICPFFFFFFFNPADPQGIT